MIGLVITVLVVLAVAARFGQRRHRKFERAMADQYRRELSVSDSSRQGKPGV